MGVADGNQAIEKLKEHQYAVILLDLMMPKTSGFDVIDYLKQHPPAIKPVVSRSPDSRARPRRSGENGRVL